MVTWSTSRGDPAEILRGLGRETVEQLEAFLEEEGIELDTLIYRRQESVRGTPPFSE